MEEIIRERRRRRVEERLRYFKPTEPPGNDQKAFLHSPAKIRAVFGGNRSGKTEIGVADGLMVCLGIHPVRSQTIKPPAFLRYCAPKYEDGIKAVVLKKIFEMVPHYELPNCSRIDAWAEKSRTLSFANGSQIRFFSYEQDVNTYGGADIDGFYMDEHAAHKYFIENMARVVDRNGYGVLTMTPEAGITWEEEHIIEASENDLDIDYWFFSTYDNPHLSQKGIKKLEDAIKDERLRDAKLRGRFVALSGLVLPQFDKAIHAIPDKALPDHWHRQFVIDPHHRKPSRMVWRAIDHDGVSFTYREAEFHPADGGVPELAEFIRTKSAGDKISQWIIDEAMGGDGKNIFGEQTVAVQLRKAGIPVVGTHLESDKAFSAGISKMRSKLLADPVTKKPTHFVFQSCTKTIKQYMTYRYKKETVADEETFREKVRNVDDDFVTCDRYGMMAEPTRRRGRSKSNFGKDW